MFSRDLPIFNDPLYQAIQYEKEREAWLRTRPKCTVCGHRIQDEMAYKISGEWICERCVKDAKRYVEED